jgi:hypothetical protein
VGIPNEDSWFLTNLYPTGVARGWRRVGCLVMLIVPLLIIVIAVGNELLR